MNRLNKLQICNLLFAFCSLFSFCHAEDILNAHKQLLVVVAPSWEAHHGTLKTYEYKNSRWEKIGNEIPVVIGKNGLGWGIGLHVDPQIPGPAKAEGDGKSPAGIFAIGKAFGFASADLKLPTKLDYMTLSSGIEAIDDVNSRYYNTIVDRQTIENKDWNSSEKMAEQPLYKYGITVNHNFPNVTNGKGSAIFFHIWEGADVGTSGCTAMKEENLLRLMAWLDKDKNPVLVQLPAPVYQKLKTHWHLP